MLFVVQCKLRDGIRWLVRAAATKGPGRHGRHVSFCIFGGPFALEGLVKEWSQCWDTCCHDHNILFESDIQVSFAPRKLRYRTTKHLQPPDNKIGQVKNYTLSDPIGFVVMFPTHLGPVL